jgi:hypothetical protein
MGIHFIGKAHSQVIVFYLVSVPPQQFITVDGGIVEVGAEVQFGIVDIVTMVKEVADHQDILRYLRGICAFSLSPQIRGIRAFPLLLDTGIRAFALFFQVRGIRAFGLSFQVRGIRALRSFS